LVLAGEGEDRPKRAAREDRGGEPSGRKAGGPRPGDRIKAIEAAMDKLSGIIADIDEKLARPGVFERAPDKALDLARARATAAERLALAEEAWLQASAEAEAAT